VKKFVLGTVIGMTLATAGGSAADDIMVTKAPPPSSIPTDFNWTGFYAGGHLGYAWGSSNWTGPDVSGSLNLAEPVDTFNEAGSFFEGLQAGYNYMLPNRVVIGAEIDASFPAFQNLAGISTGGISNFTSPTLGPVSYSETVLSSGTVRGRIGYAPGSWLFYATGGFSWSYDQLTLTQLASGTNDMPFLWRLGWAAGAGVEVPVAQHWTARLEYLFTDYGTTSVLFANAGQRFTSDFSLQELRAGLNYQFGNDPLTAVAAPTAPETDRINFHGQTTFVEQAYPAFRSPYSGAQSLPGSGQGRETTDVTLYAGVRLWQGAEAWIDPEIDQGHGLANTHGMAGFPSAEAYKQGFDYPYARVQRYFVRQTIDLGGETQKVDADINQFAGSQTANRLVLTVGKFAVVDMFDTNKYAKQCQKRFPELVGRQCRLVRLCRRRLGLHLRRRRRMVPGPLYATRRSF
jgi:high affinity Mn2+ porin